MSIQHARVGKVAVILAAVAVLSAAAFADEPGKFTNLGPGGGGAIYNASASPHDPNLVFVWCDMSGLYRSTDGGESWTMLDKRQMRNGNSCKVLFPPTDPNVVYGVGGGVLKVSVVAADDGAAVEGRDSGEARHWPQEARGHDARHRQICVRVDRRWQGVEEGRARHRARGGNLQRSGVVRRNDGRRLENGG